MARWPNWTLPMNDDLIAFLTARLDEKKAAVLAATDSSHRGKCAEWDALPDGNSYVIGDGSGHFVFCAAGAGASIAQHVILHDPARMLRDVEADRKLLAAYAEVAYMDTADPEPEYAYGRAEGLGETVRIRAAVYSDHPDYRQDL